MYGIHLGVQGARKEDQASEMLSSLAPSAMSSAYSMPGQVHSAGGGIGWRKLELNQSPMVPKQVHAIKGAFAQNIYRAEEK